MRKRNIVTIGGGSGQFVLLKALQQIPDVNITAVVAMADSGGSTGMLRDQYGVLPPGDILKCLIALSPLDNAREILQTRFSSHKKLKGHNAGNLLLTFLTEHVGGDFPTAIDALSEILQVEHSVIPVTTDKVTLVAELTNGKRLFGESAIDVVREKRDSQIKSAYLVPHNGTLSVYHKVINALREADAIIVGPGDLYTSILPNLLIDAVPSAIKKNEKAKLIYILNLMTKYGETHAYTHKNFVEVIEKSIDRPLTHIIANSKPPSKKLQDNYIKERAAFVVPPEDFDKRYVLSELLSEDGGIVRHDQKSLAETLGRLL